MILMEQPEVGGEEILMVQPENDLGGELVAVPAAVPVNVLIE